MEPEAAPHPFRLVRAACFNQGFLDVRVEMVEDDRETCRMAVARQTDTTFNLTGNVGFRAAVGHGHRTKAPVRFNGKEEIPDTSPFVFVVLSSRFARFRWRPTARVFQERRRFFITAAHRFLRIIAMGLQAENILQAGHEFRRDGRNAPQFFPARASGLADKDVASSRRWRLL
jgi:hypothetical protein